MLDDEKKEQRNMMLAMLLVVVVLMVFNAWTRRNTETVTVPLAPPVETEMPVAQTTEETIPAIEATPDEAEEPIAVIPFENTLMTGTFRANGTAVDALDLLTYRETTAPDSPFVRVLGADYGTSLNWQGAGIPDTTRAPHITGDHLTPETPVVLTWVKGPVRIERTVSLDNAYMITYTDKIINAGTVPVSATLNGRVERSVDSVPNNRVAVHEGFLALVDNHAEESRYAEIKADEDKVMTATGGWIGMTDKYWQTLFVPEQNMVSDMTYARHDDFYVASFTGRPETVAPGATLTHTTRLFSGAKELHLINAYEAQGIPRFDLSIDFGWYYFLTKPFLYFLGWLYALVGNMGVAILVFATLLRILMLPVATKTYENMAKMKKVQPKIKALQERFKDNKAQLQVEMMNLYKRDKVNPASGCLPMLIQIPVFFALYKVLSVSILMRQAPFFGWITDLSQPDPSSVFTMFGLLPWPIPSILNIGVWPVIMGLTMVLQQRLSPTPSTNPDQKIIMNLMPIIFTFMMGNFASGLVIYWTWSNILSLAQQRYIMKKVGV